MKMKTTTTDTIKLPCFAQRLSLKWVSLVTLIFQNTLIVLLMRYSRVQSDQVYLTSTAVVASEFLKFVISFTAIALDTSYGSKPIFDRAKEEIFSIDTAKLAVPGLLYTFQNNLLFIALSNLEAAVYQVSYQLKLLTTAIFTVTLLDRSLNKYQIIALVVLFGGVSLVQLDQLPDNDEDGDAQEKNQFIGMVCVLLACCSSGFAGVYMEKIFKKGKSVSLFVRNLQLSSFGFTMGLILAFSYNWTEIISDGFFQNYTFVTWSVVVIQAGSGFVIASVMKYADNILKGFATSLSIILSSVLATYIFSFHISMYFFVGGLLVVTSVFLYGYKPPAPVELPTVTKYNPPGSAEEKQPFVS